MAYLTGKLWIVLRFWYTGGAPEQRCRRCFADRLNQTLACSAGYITEEQSSKHVRCMVYYCSSLAQLKEGIALWRSSKQLSCNGITLSKQLHMVPWLPRELRTDQNVWRLSLFVKEYFPFAKKYSETLRIHIINETEATREFFAFCLTSVKEDNEKYNKKIFYVFIRLTEEGLLAVERTPN